MSDPKNEEQQPVPDEQPIVPLNAYQREVLSDVPFGDFEVSTESFHKEPNREK